MLSYMRTILSKRLNSLVLNDLKEAAIINGK